MPPLGNRAALCRNPWCTEGAARLTIGLVQRGASKTDVSANPKPSLSNALRINTDQTMAAPTRERAVTIQGDTDPSEPALSQENASTTDAGQPHPSSLDLATARQIDTVVSPLANSLAIFAFVATGITYLVNKGGLTIIFGSIAVVAGIGLLIQGWLKRQRRTAIIAASCMIAGSLFVGGAARAWLDRTTSPNVPQLAITPVIVSPVNDEEI